MAIVTGAGAPGLTFGAEPVSAGMPSITGRFSLADGAAGANAFSGMLSNTPDVGSPAIVIVPETVPAGTVGVAYNQALMGVGGVPPVHLFVTAGELPPGIVFHTQTLVSVPTTAGSFTFTVTAVDANQQTGEREYTLVIVDALALPPTDLPVASPDVAYSVALNPAIGGEPPYTYAVTAGSLPADLTLDAAGTIVGTPHQVGSFAFMVTVTDAGSRTATRDYALSVGLLPQTIVFPTQTVTQRPFVPGGTFTIDPLATGGASGNPVTYTAGPSGVCSISGVSVTMIGPGVCVITASQAGSDLYAPATPVQQSVTLVGAPAAVPMLSQAALALLALLLAGLGIRRHGSIGRMR